MLAGRAAQEPRKRLLQCFATAAIALDDQLLTVAQARQDGDAHRGDLSVRGDL
jgi:hypothetical protein